MFDINVTPAIDLSKLVNDLVPALEDLTNRATGLLGPDTVIEDNFNTVSAFDALSLIPQDLVFNTESPETFFEDFNSEGDPSRLPGIVDALTGLIEDAWNNLTDLFNFNQTVENSNQRDNAGNYWSPRNIGTLSNFTLNDYVGRSDLHDRLQFQVGQAGDFRLRLTGLSADADVVLQNAQGKNLAWSLRRGSANEEIVGRLAAGTYYVWIYSGSYASRSINGDTNYTLSMSLGTNPSPNPNPSPSDWFSQNLKDAGLIQLTRQLAADGNLSRQDMLSIFRNAQDNNSIDGNEVNDLRTIVNNGSRFNMAEHVRFLSRQVAEGATVNMGASQFESNLVGRWLLGTVPPSGKFNNVTLSHEPVNGSLFGSAGSARIGDIDQGGLGDCSFLAALGATFGAQSNDGGNQRSSVVDNMIINNGDNTYTFKFFAGNSAQYVTVDNRLAKNNGQVFGARATDALWAPLTEKAYAQWREWREGGHGYELIGNGDIIERPLGFVTGKSVSYTPINSVTFDQLRSSLQTGKSISTGVMNAKDTNMFVNSHAYSVTNAYTSGSEQRVVVRNPWGVDGRSTAQGNPNDGFLDISFAQFKNNFFGVAVA